MEKYLAVNPVFVIDTNAPTVTLNTPANRTATNTTSQNITANLTDNLGIKNATTNVYFTNGTLYNQTTTNFASGIVSSTVGIVINFINGIYTWFYQVFDWAGNSALSDNRTLTIDTAVPSLTFNQPTSYQNISSRIITINITVNDSLSGLNYTNFTIYNSTNSIVNLTSNASAGSYNISLTVPADGIFSISLIAYDNATNINSTSRNITIDTINPSITINSPINNSIYYANQSIIIQFSMADSNPNTYWYNYNETTNITYTGPIAINYTSTGIKNITFYIINLFKSNLLYDVNGTG